MNKIIIYYDTKIVLDKFIFRGIYCILLNLYYRKHKNSTYEHEYECAYHHDDRL